MKMTIRVWLLAVMVATVFWLLVFTIAFSGETDVTCPNYGEVPVIINGETICVPWETVADIEQHRDDN